MKLFIVFDGIDGNGKTTQAKLLEKWLEEKGFPVFYTSEPSESEYGKTIEILLRKKTAASIPKEKWIELFTKDRKEHVKIIKSFLKQDKIVISDRYYYSTLAYQLSEEKWQDYASLFLKPNLTFILDLPATVAMERLKKKYKITKEKKAYFEKLKILRKARKKFLLLPNYLDDNIKIINSNRPIKNVSEDIKKEVLLLIKSFGKKTKL